MQKKLWQLVNLQTKAVLRGPENLPDNWAGIFGLAGIKEKLAELSWMGPTYSGLGWVEVVVGVEDVEEIAPDVLIKNRVKELLAATDWAMLPDVPMTVGQKQDWIAYRRALRGVKHQPKFPHNVQWPVAPE